MVVRDRGGGVEEVVEALGEDLLRGAGRLHEEEAVVLRHLGGRDDEAGGEGAEDEVDAVLVDQLLVVGGDPVGVGLVVEDRQLDVAPEQAAVLVDVVGPGLVAALDPLAGLAEVAGERQRDADGDGTVALLALVAGAGAHAPGEGEARRPGPGRRGGGGVVTFMSLLYA